MYHNISGSSKGDSINTKSQTEQAKKCSSYFLNITKLFFFLSLLDYEQTNITSGGTVDCQQHHGAAFGFGGCCHRGPYR